MRQITIDFNTSLIEAGYLGEHNATELVVVKPADVIGAMYSVAFMTNGEVVHSKFFGADENIKVPLWQQLTQDYELGVQLEAYDKKGDYLGKSAMITLLFGGSAHGTDVVADSDNPDVYSEIALNTWFRETLEDNADTLDKLTTSKDGTLLFNGEEIKGGGGSSSLDVEVKTDTEDEYVLEIITDTETITTPNLKGTDGKSGVYVGSGDMPEGYNVQIDPNGEATPIIKVAEQPTFVNSIGEMTDTNKAYVLLPEGYIYAYMKADAQALTVSDFVGGTVQSDGSITLPDASGWVSRIATKNLLPLSDKIFVSCPSPYQYFVYYYTDNDERTFIGKTDWKSGSIDDISTDVVASGTKDGAKYCRISLRDSTDTSADLQNRFAEFMENITITQESATGKAWVNTGLAYNQPADYEDRIIALEKALGDIMYGNIES